MLEVTNLGYERNERYLFQHLNFRLMEGDALRIIGPNGSGKTTLLKTLTGLIVPTEGNVCWQQQSIYRYRSDFYAQLLYLGHLCGVTLQLTPRENLAYQQGASSQLLPEAALYDALAQTGLGDDSNTPCYLLSAGQQRRVALARLLLSTAKLWILDEPLTALDPEGIELIEKLIARHLHHQGMIIITSHQPLSWENTLPQEIILA